MALLSIIAGLAAGVAGGCGATPSVPSAPLRLALAADYSFGLALAPDGRRVGYVRSEGGTTQLWLHDLTSDTRTPLDGTEGGALPFWAPDGSAVGFFAAGLLRTVTLADGRVHDLADAPSARGGAWHTNGDILFAPDDRGLRWRRSSGAIEPFTTLDGSESSHRYPRLTGDGRHVVFFVRAGETTRQGIALSPVLQPAARRRVVASEAEGLLVEQALLYASGGALVAQRLDLESLALAGRPVLLGSRVGVNAEHQLFATAGGEVLLFGAASSQLRELRWVDRTGAPAGVLGEPMDAWDVRIAPRGPTVVVTRADPQLRTLDIWAYEDQRPLPRRLSPNIDRDEAPTWSRDGTRVAWVSGRRVVTLRDAGAARPDTALRTFDDPVRVTDWSPRDEWLVVTATGRETGADVVLLRADGSGEPRAYASTAFNETHGTVSRDGRWMAYASDESGRPEIYVDTFPAPARRARVSVGGGTEPRWGEDGALYFRRGAEIHALRLREVGGALEAASSERLFDAGADIRSYDVTPDGRRFLINVPAAGAAAPSMTAVVHLRALLP